MFHLMGQAIFGLVVGIVAKLLMPGKDPGGFIVTALIGPGLAGRRGLRIGLGNVDRRRDAAARRVSLVLREEVVEFQQKPFPGRVAPKSEPAFVFLPRDLQGPRQERFAGTHRLGRIALQDRTVDESRSLVGSDVPGRGRAGMAEARRERRVLRDRAVFVRGRVHDSPEPTS
jgi:hypothetical protein